MVAQVNEKNAMTQELDLTVEMDTSLQGWGVALQGCMNRGLQRCTNGPRQSKSNI